MKQKRQHVPINLMCCKNILIFNYFVRLTVHMNWNVCIGRKNVRLSILSGNQWRWNSLSRKEKRRYENQIFCWFHLKLKLTDKAISCMLPKKNSHSNISMPFEIPAKVLHRYDFCVHMFDETSPNASNECFYIKVFKYLA